MALEPDAYERTLAWLYRIETRSGIDLKLERVRAAAAALGHPERAAPTWHVGGTNGKGSTAAMLAALLAARGLTVGLYTSPHLVSFRERIVVGGEQVGEDEVVAGIARIRRALGAEPALTCFETMTMLAWCVFAEHAVDATVLEVGLGGRLDATNIVDPEVAVITNVGIDHEEYLGHDVATIAGEKAGIVKPRVPVVTAAEGVALDVIAARARALASPLHVLGRDFALERDAAGRLAYRSAGASLAPLELALAGTHQQRNAALALRALEITRGLDDGETARAALASVRWPGRLQVVTGAPLVLLDGAHNAPGVEVLVEEVRALAAGRPVRVLFGAMRDKPWRRMLESLATLAREVVTTRPRQPRSADPAELAAAARVPARAIADPETAFRALVAASAPEDVVLVTGSLFLVGDVLPIVDPTRAADAARERAAAALAGRA